MKALLIAIALMLGVSGTAIAAPKHVKKVAVHAVKKEVFPASRNFMSQKGYDRWQNYLKTGVWSPAGRKR